MCVQNAKEESMVNSLLLCQQGAWGPSPPSAWPENAHLPHDVDWGMAHLHHGCRKPNNTGIDRQRVLTCSCSLVSQLRLSCWSYVFKTVCVALLLRRLMDSLTLTLEGRELRGSTVASISRSSTGSVVSSVLQLDPVGSYSLLLLVKFWSFPFPQVSTFSGIFLAAFGHPEILGTDHQIKRSEVFPAFALRHSLCVYCSTERARHS